MNCGIIAVVMGIILSIIGKFLSTVQKHNRYKIEHNRLGLNSRHPLDYVPHTKVMEITNKLKSLSIVHSSSSFKCPGTHTLYIHIYN